jgi:hypothetical protein
LLPSRIVKRFDVIERIGSSFTLRARDSRSRDEHRCNERHLRQINFPHAQARSAISSQAMGSNIRK